MSILIEYTDSNTKIEYDTNRKEMSICDDDDNPIILINDSIIQLKKFLKKCDGLIEMENLL